MIALAGLAMPLITAHAQSLDTPAKTVDEGLRRQIERERLQQQASAPHADNLQPAAGTAALPKLPQEQPCFVIREVALTGPDASRFRWLDASTTPLLNQCIGVQGLSMIAAYLDAQLVEQGYVTSRVSLGPQNLGGGRLEFRLHAGRIERVQMVDADAEGRPADDRWGTWRNAFPLHEGGLLDARALEQGVEQMKRLPSQSVATTLAPGSAPDTSVVTIERRLAAPRQRIRGGLTLDNSGSPSLGRTQASFNLALNNPLGVNDVLALNANTNAEQPRADHRSQGAGLSYSVPWGYATLSASASHNRFAQIVQLPTLPHLSSGHSDTAELRIDDTAWRTASAKTGLFAALSTRRSASYLDDTELLTQRRKTTFWETGASFRQLYANNASLDLNLSYKRGVSWLQAQDDFPVDPLDPAAVPTLRPRLWTLDASFVLPFELRIHDAPRGLQYSATLVAQGTPDHTLSVDQIAIGGRNTVRGFDGDSVLIAENGWYLRNELAAALPVDHVAASLYLGVDGGRVWGYSASSLPGHALAGAALGLRGQWSAWQFDFALASPIVKPEGFKTGRWNLYASTTYAF